MAGKFSWTEADNLNCTLYYLNNITPNKAHNLMPHIPLNSIKMKYKNCLYLERGNVKGSLSHVSKMHNKIWCELRN